MVEQMVIRTTPVNTLGRVYTKTRSPCPQEMLAIVGRSLTGSIVDRQVTHPAFQAGIGLQKSLFVTFSVTN